jgi:hypothetical protein
MRRLRECGKRSGEVRTKYRNSNVTGVPRVGDVPHVQGCRFSNVHDAYAHAAQPGQNTAPPICSLNAHLSKPLVQLPRSHPAFTFSQHRPHPIPGPSRAMSESQANPTAGAPSSIHEAYALCLSRIKDVAVCFSERTRTGLNITLPLDAYGRLQTWGQESGAMFPKSSSRSLDQSLKIDLEFKEAALDLLKDMHDRLSSRKQRNTLKT